MNTYSLRATILGLSACLFLGMGSNVLAADYKITSLDWAPYTNDRLPAQGASSAVVTEAFKAAGNTAKIEFYPWNRAVDMAKTDKAYIAYFPEYHSKANEADFLYSDPIGVGPLVFVERKADPITWNSYESLKGKRIGVVKGYVNTDELDARIASKALSSDEALDDAKNLLKLAASRVDVAVIDINVFNYLVRNDAAVKAVAGLLQVNGKVLEDKKLYVCFKKSPEGEKALKEFNQGLKKIDAEAIMKKLIN